MHTEDRELEGKLAVVEKFNNRIPELVKRIQNCAQSTPNHAGQKRSQLLIKAAILNPALRILVFFLLYHIHLYLEKTIN